MTRLISAILLASACTGGGNGAPDAGGDAGPPPPRIACSPSACADDQVCCATSLTYSCSTVAECPSRNGTCPMSIQIPGDCGDSTHVCHALGAPDCTGSLVWLGPGHTANPPVLTVITISSGWCPACRELGPQMAAIEADYSPRGVHFMDALSEDDNYNPADQAFCEGWTSQYNLDRPSLIDPCGTVLSMLAGGTGGTIGLPAVYIYDAEGYIIYRGEAVTGTQLRTALDGFLPSGG